MIRQMWLMVLLVCMLSGCTTINRPPEVSYRDQFNRMGRFSYVMFDDQKVAESINGGFIWTDDGQHYSLRLSDPFGAQLAELRYDGKQAVLVDNKRNEYIASTPEALLFDLLHDHVPVQAMRAWFRGEVDALHILKKDNDGHPAEFQFAPWRVYLNDYDHHGPTKAWMTRTDGLIRVELKFSMQPQVN